VPIIKQAEKEISMKKLTCAATIATLLLALVACNVENHVPVAPHESLDITSESTTVTGCGSEPQPVGNEVQTTLRVSPLLLEFAANEDGTFYEIGGDLFFESRVWGEEPPAGSEIWDSPYESAVISYILAERIYAGTGRGSPFWAELYEQGMEDCPHTLCECDYFSCGQKKQGEVMIVGYNFYHETNGDLFLSAARIFEEIQLPPLYRLLRDHEISEEVFMAYHAEEFMNLPEGEGLWEGAWYPPPPGRLWSRRSPEFLRLMFLPEDEMRAALLNERGAIFNGTVHNILTLNELFLNDREAFAQIDLQELIQFQQNLESVGIYRGFNADMVEFANTYNANSADVATS
jgi:hypothetical protein